MSVLPFPEQPGRGDVSQVLNNKGRLKTCYQPSTLVRKEWQKEGQRREDPGYAARWSAFWGRVVRTVAACGSVGDIDVHWVEEYIRRCRLAELHRYEAETEPYQTYESGYVAAHPGFAQSRAEAKLARALAADLGITPTTRRESGVEVPRPDAAAPAWVDDQDGL